MNTTINENLNNIRDLKKEQFETLYQVTRILNSAVYEETLIENTLDLIIKVINAERGLFAKYDESSDAFSIIAARNIQKESITNLSSFSSGILKQVISTGKPCLYHDVQSDPTVSQFQSLQIQKIKSIVGVPIFYNEKIWGVLIADSQGNRKDFTNENLVFLDFFSNIVSLTLNKIIEMEKLQDENSVLINQLESTHRIPDIIGESPAMKSIAILTNKAAKTNVSVLLLGESGTGKDLLAKAIHKLSPRKDNAYLAQFCGSIPDSLLESELFGYKKGAFTGANTDKKGLLEVADKGTFFLDEIADISTALQSKLLRVLENQEIIRLGDTQVKKIDIRIIAATNKDLKQMVKDGQFREDLFYRLNVFPITIPPLRERRSDILLLAKYFADKYTQGGMQIPPETIKKLENYYWPGNVRQLENVIRRAIILAESNKLVPDTIILEETEEAANFSGTLEDFERMLLEKRLKEFNGNRTLTAKSLDVSVRWIQLKLKEMNP